MTGGLRRVWTVEDFLWSLPCSHSLLIRSPFLAFSRWGHEWSCTAPKILDPRVWRLWKSRVLKLENKQINNWWSKQRTCYQNNLSISCLKTDLLNEWVIVMYQWLNQSQSAVQFINTLFQITNNRGCVKWCLMGLIYHMDVECINNLSLKRYYWNQAEMNHCTFIFKALVCNLRDGTF